MFVLYDHTAAEGATDRLYRATVSKHAGIGAGRYTALPWFAGRVLAGPRPWEALRHIVMNVAYGKSRDTATMLGLLRRPGVLGFAAVTETWGVERVDLTAFRKLLDQAARDGGRGRFDTFQRADGSVETRNVWSIDLAGRAHRVSRIRGAGQELEMDGPFRGDFTTSMRILSDAVTGRTPPASEFAERYPTLRQAVARRRR